MSMTSIERQKIEREREQLHPALIPAREKRRMYRDLAERDVVCPGGEKISETVRGVACRCKIVAETITAAENPSSLLSYCMGKHTECPIWRDDRERWWANRESVMDDVPKVERTLRLDDVPISDRIPLDPEAPVRQ